MVWLNHGGGVQPAGQKTGSATINGASWDVWTAPLGSAGFNTIWNIVSYVAQSPTTQVDFDLKPFFDDSISRQMLSSAWYLIDVEAGFELWSGPSATSNGFTVDFNERSGGGIDPSAWYTLQSVRYLAISAALLALSFMRMTWSMDTSCTVIILPDTCSCSSVDHRPNASVM